MLIKIPVMYNMIICFSTQFYTGNRFIQRYKYCIKNINIIDQSY